MKSLLKVRNFSPHSKELRSFFDEQFQDPRSLNSSRFVWDYWHVPDQYTLLRTPAYEYFPKSIYMKIHKDLVMWGRRTLGCWDISPPWLSCYIEGCEQKLHSDVPHGPWAFVYSLSPRNLPFKGGETLLLKDPVLNYWQNPEGSGDNEYKGLMEIVKPFYNQLTVFDPRIPHGVSRVSGTQDPRQGRLVVHGWFSNPKTYVDGYLPAKSTERILNQAVAQVVAQLKDQLLWGTLSVGLKVSSNGKVRSAQFFSQTVKDAQGKEPKIFLKQILKIYRELEFSVARGSTDITVPLIFS